MKLPVTLALALLTAACQSTSEPAPPMPDDMSPEEIFAMLDELGKPGEQHAFLGQMVGTFDAEVDLYMAPDAPPEKASGTMVNRWILGERYLRGDYNGEFMERPFRGLSLTGYDNATGLFQGTWMDTMSTGMMPTSMGVREGNAIRMEREMYDVMVQDWVTQTDILTVESRDSHTLEMFSGSGDEMVKTMEIRYTRQQR